MNHFRRPLIFLIKSFICQLCSFLLILLIKNHINHIFYLVAIYFIFIYILTSYFKLPLSWRFLNALFMPTFAILNLYKLSFFLPALIGSFLILIYLPTIWTSVPYYPSSTNMYQAIVNLLPKNKHFHFADLGCGYGSMLYFLAKQRPNGQYYGNEISIFPYFIAKIRSFFYPNVKIEMKSFWEKSYSDIDYIYAFLAPGPMPELWNKIKEELKPHAVFMANSFPVPAEPYQIIPVFDHRECVLYLYRKAILCHPERSEGSPTSGTIKRERTP